MGLFGRFWDVRHVEMLPGTAAFAADCLLQAHTTPLPRLFLVELTQHHGSNFRGDRFAMYHKWILMRRTAEALHRTRTYLPRSISKVPLGGEVVMSLNGMLLGVS